MKPKEKQEPLFLKPVLQEKIWGARHLAGYGYDLPADKIGEAWAISAHPHGVSTIKNGVYAGWKLDKLYQEHRELFANSQQKKFPLLTKILDANDWLSVQVHPDDAYAKINEGELGKTECWYVLAAAPQAEIIYGHTAKTKEELAEKIKTGDWEHLLSRVKVKTGDFFYVPAGTMHAVGAGLVILETQQSSDTTYRVYDFDRKDKAGNLRPLHVQQSLDTLKIPGSQLPSNLTEELPTKTGKVTRLLNSDFFDVYRLAVENQLSFKKMGPYSLVSIVDGEGELDIFEQTYSVKKGDHFILPSAIEAFRLTGRMLAILSCPKD